MRLLEIGGPCWCVRRAFLVPPPHTVSALEADGLDRICTCEIREGEDEVYEGKVTWELRVDSPKYYLVSPEKYWNNFPRLLNAITEYAHIHWRVAKFLRPADVRNDGFVFSWEVDKEGNQKSERRFYEICFETMTQTLWKGNCADTPRRIRRCVAKAGEPARKKQRVGTGDDEAAL